MLKKWKMEKLDVYEMAKKLKLLSMVQRDC